MAEAQQHHKEESSGEESVVDEYEVLNFAGDVDWSTTAVLRCDPGGGPFSEHDVLSAIYSTVRRDQVFNLGPTPINHVFTLCMKSEFDLGTFLKRASENKLKVKGHPCVAERVPTACVSVSVRWIPLEVDAVHIMEVLKPYGTVVKSESVKSRHRGWFHVYTNERRFTLRLNSNVSVADLPYGIFVKGMFGAVMVRERNPKCKDCYFNGHKSNHCEYEGCPFDFRNEKMQP